MGRREHGTAEGVDYERASRAEIPGSAKESFWVAQASPRKRTQATLLKSLFEGRIDSNCLDVE
jgi:hypothetical protein